MMELLSQDYDVISVVWEGDVLVSLAIGLKYAPKGQDLWGRIASYVCAHHQDTPLSSTMV